MHQSNVNLLDLPNEILLKIFKILNNIDILYSLFDIDNQRLDMILQEKINYTYKNYDKSFTGDDKSRINKSKISCSLGRKPSKHKNKEKEEEISYYKILYENLQN